MHARVSPAGGDIYEFVRILKDRWIVLLAFIVAGLAAAVLYLNLATYTYAVSFRVTPNESEVGNLSGKLGGLAAVAGLNLGADRAIQPFELYVESFYSPEVAARLSTRTDILKQAFPDEWNDRTGAWEEPRSPVRLIGRGVKSALGIPVFAWEQPNAARLQEYIKDEVILVRDPKKSVTTFSMDHANPDFAVLLLSSLHESVDEMIRERALRRANSYIDYLSMKLTEVLLAEHREALATTLGEQERVRMMSSSSMPYAAEPLGEPIVSLRPTKPKPLLILVLGVMAGGFLGIVAVLGLRFWGTLGKRNKAGDGAGEALPKR